METMDLTYNNDGMVPISQQQPPPSLQNDEKNIDKDQYTTQKMDSTPIDDIMNTADLAGGAPLDPRAGMQPQAPGAGAAQAVAPQQQAVQAVQAVATPPSKNPLNLTDEQLEALFVGLVAVIAFAKPVQEKLAQTIPQFLDTSGGRSTVGIAVTGLMAALIYYFGRRFVMPH
jgi:hypothetical protein